MHKYSSMYHVCPQCEGIRAGSDVFLSPSITSSMVDRICLWLQPLQVQGLLSQVVPVVGDDNVGEEPVVLGVCQFLSLLHYNFL